MAKDTMKRVSTRDLLDKHVSDQELQYTTVIQNLNNNTTLLYASFGVNALLCIVILFVCFKTMATRREIKDSKKDILFKLSQFSSDIGKSVNSIETGVNILATITGSRSSGHKFEVKGGSGGTSTVNNVGRDAENEGGICE